MVRWKRVMASAVFLVSVGFAAVALPPSLALGGYFEGGAASTLPSAGTIYTDARLQASFGWRQGLGPGSYLAVTSRASISPYVTAAQGLVDSELLNLELGLPSGADSFIVDAGVDSSIENQTVSVPMRSPRGPPSTGSRAATRVFSPLSATREAISSSSSETTTTLRRACSSPSTRALP